MVLALPVALFLRNSSADFWLRVPCQRQYRTADDIANSLAASSRAALQAQLQLTHLNMHGLFVIRVFEFL